MDAINQALLIAGILLLVAIALSAASQRVGIPSLLVFLAVGLLATELPGAPAVSIEPQTAALVGNLALAVILARWWPAHAAGRLSHGGRTGTPTRLDLPEAEYE